MQPRLPEPVLAVDAALHDLYARVHFSRFLNPTNAREARVAFLEGRHAPPFQYHVADWADDELRRLDAMNPPEDHPMGLLLLRAIEGTTLFVRALRDRSPEAFDDLARLSDWYPDDATLRAAVLEIPADDHSEMSVRASEMVEALRQGLAERGLAGWVVETDPVMSARVLVDGAKRLLRVSPHARFRKRDVERLIVHEIEVHAIRTANGLHQPLKLFSTGLPGSMDTEEGLALVAEERAGVASPGTAWRQGLVTRAVMWGRELGFRELYDRVAHEAGPGLAWGIAERLKRGLGDAGQPGVYAKDVVYYQGIRRVRAWLAAGNPVAHLYVGKVGLDDPVTEWLNEGLVTLQPVPATFAGGT